MEVYFNELSLDDNTTIQYQDIERLSGLYSCMKSKSITGCRISPDDYRNLISQAKTMKGSNPNVINFLYAFLRQPYEGSDVEKKQEDYLSSVWSYQGKECFGLALAYITESMSVSICDRTWKEPIITIFKGNDIVEVRNLFDSDTFTFHLNWLDEHSSIQLMTCTEEPEKKKIKLRPDHGKDILNDYCKRIVHCEYICEVVNSLPFNSKKRRFIHRIKENGLIEIVLPWTDEGYGIVVKTTGRNMRETEKIATILKEKYGSV